MTKIEIKLVNYEGELFFEFNGTMFDLLDAFTLEDGHLTVIRDGKIINSAMICLYGTHAASVCFWIPTERRYYPSELFPDDFQVGDILSIEIPNLDFAAWLLDAACRESAGEEVFKDVPPDISVEKLEEFMVVAAKKFDELRPGFKMPKIIRWRAKAAPTDIGGQGGGP